MGNLTGTLSKTEEETRMIIKQYNCKAAEGYCKTQRDGTFVWLATDSICPHKLRDVYVGPATIHTNNQNNQSVLTIKHQGKYMGQNIFHKP